MSDLRELAIELSRLVARALATPPDDLGALQGLRDLRHIARAVSKLVEQRPRGVFAFSPQLAAAASRLRKSPAYAGTHRPSLERARNAAKALQRAIEQAEGPERAIKRCTKWRDLMRAQLVEAVLGGHDLDGLFARLATAEEQLSRAYKMRSRDETEASHAE